MTEDSDTKVTARGCCPDLTQFGGLASSRLFFGGEGRGAARVGAFSIYLADRLLVHACRIRRFCKLSGWYDFDVTWLRSRSQLLFPLSITAGIL